MCRGHMLSLIFIEKKLFERFPKTNCQKQIKNNLKLKKQQLENVINYILNGKGHNNSFNNWFDKKDIV